MRWSIALLVSVRLVAAENFFELRRHPPDSDLYRGMIASRFGRELEGIGVLRRFLATNPPPADARRAHQELADAFSRLTRYREAAEEWREVLQLLPANDPEREDAENSLALRESLRDVPSQTAERGIPGGVQAKRNRLGSWNVPLRVNGTAADWIFDTGADFTTVSESEARRLGLDVFDSSAVVAGSTGVQNPLRLAVAKDVEFAGVRIHNVALLVIADDRLTIGPKHFTIAGILGLPVLRALGSMSIAANGTVRVGHGDAGEPNLYFDGESPVVEAEHAGHRVQLYLDTGANRTKIFPSFRAALSAAEVASLRNKKEHIGGVGTAEATILATRLPALELRFFSSGVTLRDVTMQPRQPTGENADRDGVLGMDALFGGFTLDFGSMRLSSGVR